MLQKVCMGALLKCSFGKVPSSLVVLPEKRVFTHNVPLANILDNKPLVNILPFGLCNAPTNPAVIAAISSSAGSVTDAPCVPAVVAPWQPGASTILLGGNPALTNNSKCQCSWGGMIEILQPGQATVFTG